MKQRTIVHEFSVAGIGLHSGARVGVTFRPAPAGAGIVYRRTDLNPVVEMACNPEQVLDTHLCTALVNDAGIRISTVEHLTASLSALGIENLYVDVNAPELPILDGSSQPFIYLFEEAGITELPEPKQFIRVKRLVRVEDQEKWAQLAPSDGFSLDLTIDFDHPAMERELQRFRLDFSGQSFVDELSRARTFCFMRDVEYMHAHNLALGGSLDNAVVLDDYRVINPNGLRYPNEFVKHKLLDAVGDLYMSTRSVIGAFSAFKTGHSLNNRLLRALLSDKENYELISGDEPSGVPLDFLDVRREEERA